MVYFVITMLVSGGMIPTYLVVTGAGVKRYDLGADPSGGAPGIQYGHFNEFMRGIPEEIEEAAAIDGASPFQILTRVLLPILKPALATVGLFCIVTHWNDWFSGMIYMNNPDQLSASDISAVFASEILNSYCGRRALRIFRRSLRRWTQGPGGRHSFSSVRFRSW